MAPLKSIVTLCCGSEHREAIPFPNSSRDQRLPLPDALYTKHRPTRKKRSRGKAVCDKNTLGDEGSAPPEIHLLFFG